MPGRGRPFNKKYETEAERQAALKAASARYYAKNKERVLARSQARYYADKPTALAQARVRNLKNFGMTPEQYEERLEAQGGVCAICKGPPVSDKVYCVDHDHQTGAVRGLLCRKCNSGIGYLRDDPSIVRVALEYLGG